jgi:hypothetical protein
MSPADDVGATKPVGSPEASAGERAATATSPDRLAEIDYDALADEVARDYPKILARLAE